MSKCVSEWESVGDGDGGGDRHRHTDAEVHCLVERLSRSGFGEDQVSE